MKHWPLTPTVRWLCYAAGSSLYALVQSLSSPLEGKVTANQYKVALSDHLYLVMKHSCWEQSPSGQYPFFKGDEGPLNGAMTMKMYVTTASGHGCQEVREYLQ